MRRVGDPPSLKLRRAVNAPYLDPFQQTYHRGVKPLLHRMRWASPCIRLLESPPCAGRFGFHARKRPAQARPSNEQLAIGKLRTILALPSSFPSRLSVKIPAVSDRLKSSTKQKRRTGLAARIRRTSKTSAVVALTGNARAGSRFRSWSTDRSSHPLPWKRRPRRAPCCSLR